MSSVAFYDEHADEFYANSVGADMTEFYGAFLPLIPALPGLFLAFLPLRPAMWQMLVPTFGQQVLINQLMRGEPIDPLFTAVSAAVTLAIGLLLALAAMRLFGREQVLFGRGE